MAELSHKHAMERLKKGLLIILTPSLLCQIAMQSPEAMKAWFTKRRALKAVPEN